MTDLPAGKSGAPGPRKRKRHERVPTHLYVQHPENPGACQHCGLAGADRAHIPGGAQDGPPERIVAESAKWEGGAGRDPETKRFLAGNPGGPGQKPGWQTDAMVEVRKFCQRVIGDLAYQAGIVLRARAGLLHPAVEVMLWHYAIGKPKETVEVQGDVPFAIVFQTPRHDPLADDPQAALPPGDDGL